jgi:Uma2 family endonuclease
MLNPAALSPSPAIIYPDSDGQPMAENTKQLRWIVTLLGNIAAQFRLRADVFVAADLLWYPVEGYAEIRTAPDVLVVFGRPKGDRSSYKQWEEEGIPVTVAFEILSPGNTVMEMSDKFAFYEDYGVEEYYLYDPDSFRLHVYLRRGEILGRQRRVKGFISPRLGIRFEPGQGDMEVYGPNGQRFLTFEELEAARTQAQEQVEQVQKRARRLAELSRKARQQQASPEELAELERLEGEASS